MIASSQCYTHTIKWVKIEPYIQTMLVFLMVGDGTFAATASGAIADA